MKKKIYPAFLSVGVAALGLLSTDSAQAHSQEKEKFTPKVTWQSDKMENRIELPIIETGRGEVRAQLSIVNGQIVFSTQIQGIPDPYLSARFFTHEDGIYKSLPYSQSGSYDFYLTSGDLNILRQQSESLPHASVGIDILNSDEQIPTAMLYISDIVHAYDQLNSIIIKGSSARINPFHIGQDQMITGTVDTTETEKKDTLMLTVNGLGRRLLHIPALPENQQSPDHAFEIYAKDFVTDFEQNVSIVHIKDGKVISDVPVPLI